MAHHHHISGSRSLRNTTQIRTPLDGANVNQASGAVTPCWAEVVHSSMRAGDAQALHAREALTNFMKDKNSEPFYEQKKSFERFRTEYDDPPSLPNVPLDTISLPTRELPQWPPARTTTTQTSYISPPRRRLQFAAPTINTPVLASDTPRSTVGCLSRHTGFMNALENAYASSRVDDVRRMNGRARDTNANALRTESSEEESVEGDACAKSEAEGPAQERSMAEPRNHVEREAENGEGHRAGNGLNRSAKLRGFGFTVGVSFSFRYD